MIITYEEGAKRGFGCHPVTEVRHYFIKLPCGKRLGAKFWLPSDSAEDFDDTLRGTESIILHEGEKPTKLANCTTFPSILEFLPYRKTEGTVERDHERHTWMSSHGYIVARVDMRGSGQILPCKHEMLSRCWANAGPAS